MEIAVIGGSGFLGTHLLNELRSRNCSIRLITSGSSKPRQISGSTTTKTISVSFEDQSQLQQSLSGCDAIAYLSGINRERHPGDFQKVHVDNLEQVILAASETSIKKFVYASFLKARPGTASKYLQSKWDGERLLRSSPLDYTILKPGICFGPGDQMISSIVRGLKMTPMVGLFAAVGMREPTMQPIHARDMALVMAEALLNGRLSRQTNAVVGPEEFPLSEAVLRVSAVLKKKVFIFNVPVPVMFALAWMMEHVMNNSLVTVSQIRMLADGLSEISNSARVAEDEQPLPDDLKPKTYFTVEQIQEVVDQIR